MINFVRRFVEYYAEITGPLVLLIGKDYVLKGRFKKAWGTEKDNAFARTKRVLSAAPVLHFPDF